MSTASPRLAARLPEAAGEEEPQAIHAMGARSDGLASITCSVSQKEAHPLASLLDWGAASCFWAGDPRAAVLGTVAHDRQATLTRRDVAAASR